GVVSVIQPVAVSIHAGGWYVAAGALAFYVIYNAVIIRIYIQVIRQAIAIGVGQRQRRHIIYRVAPAVAVGICAICQAVVVGVRQAGFCDIGHTVIVGVYIPQVGYTIPVLVVPGRVAVWLPISVIIRAGCYQWCTTCRSIVRGIY